MIEGLRIGGERVGELRAGLDGLDHRTDDGAEARVLDLIDQILQALEKRDSGASHLREMQAERDEIFRFDTGPPRSGKGRRAFAAGLDQFQLDLR